MLPFTHSTNLYDKMLTNCNIITASNDSVISCDNIQINHSFLMSFSSYQQKFLMRKLKEYYPHQSVVLKILRICIYKWMQPQTTHHAGHFRIY